MNQISNEYDSVKDKVRSLLDKQTDSGHHTFRKIKDLVAKHSIAVGGVSVILAVVMIFFYLLYVVFPIFRGAELTQENSYSLSVQKSVIWGMEEYGEVGFRIDHNGDLLYFDAQNGESIESFTLNLLPEESIRAAVYANREDNLLAVGLSSGRVLFVKLAFRISYPEGVRKITPAVEYPYGEDGVELEADSLDNLAVAKNEDFLNLVAVTGSNLQLVRYEFESSFLDDSLELEEIANQTFSSDVKADFVLHDPAGQWLYVVSKSGDMQSFWLEDDELQPNERLKLVKQNTKVTEAKLLLGGTSLMIGDASGVISQWFPVRDDTNTYRLTKIRSFEFSDVAVRTIYPEIRRKGFIAIDDNNQLGIFYTTSHRTVLLESMSAHEDAGEGALTLALNPRGSRMLLANGDALHAYHVDNEHPDLSWSALWSKVWYESYPEPQYTWQSSASTTDFEAKFSLVPLSFGTLKAAFYAMLFAMPLAICGAIFTAYFMAPKMRTMVKPAVEVMEALPTVILGFLAGLWLAPAMEENLPGVFMILMFLPIFIIAFGALWYWLPSSITHRIPDGWQAALLIPVIVLVSYLCLEFSYPVEKAFFNGDMRVWLEEIGINYDQRNSLVVGIAMGFAVIPTIFSIAEDAIFSVPKHLTSGSLALGASPWQTLVRVVLPTASPGIFSAVMIGLGRAVGETMIVLMATGNTPIMEANIFEGMRTLSANIAVEMPESEVGSSHYRVLFLAGFVLFVFTFVFNTLAENVRHRLRKKYGSL